MRRKRRVIYWLRADGYWWTSDGWISDADFMVTYKKTGSSSATFRTLKRAMRVFENSPTGTIMEQVLIKKDHYLVKWEMEK